MKYIKVSLILCLNLASAFLSAQTIALQNPQIRLGALMDSISLRTNLRISYDARAVPVDSMVHMGNAEVPVYHLLKQILRGRALNVTLSDDQIIISKIVEKQSLSYIHIQGEVVDAMDSLPLPLVNIGIKGTTLGTISNMQGDFGIVLPGNLGRDTLVFSCLGYRSKRISIAGLHSQQRITMRRFDIPLKEVEVRYEDADRIVDRIIEHRNQNYYTKPAVLTGFFRESIKQDEDYVQVSEAIIEIQKPAYDSKFALEKVRFIKGRKLAGLQAMDQIAFKLEGGPYQFSRIDLARYLDFLPDEQMESKYRYQYSGIDFFGDHMVYHLKFSPVEDDGELKYQGDLYVHSSSYALVHAHFQLTRKSLKNSRRALIKKESGQLKARPRMARYYIDYRPFGDRWILNKVGGEIVVHINDRKRKINAEFSGVSELLISDCNFSIDERFKGADLYKPNFILAEQIQETDTQFWENYNIIKPEEEIEKVFKKAMQLGEERKK